MSTWYVDLNNGNDSNSGNSFANRVKTLTRVSALAMAGDTVRVMGNTPTSSGTATWTNGSSLVTLSTALTLAIYNDGTWTASTHVTASANTSSPSPKQGANCVKLVCASTFTTGKVAYYATGTLNLSAYQQVSFWVQSSVALASGALSINLCSDTAGATIVDTLTLNQALNANEWTCVTINNGSALSSSIKSVRLTANSSLASTDIYIDNVVACKAPSAAGCLTLNTLISPDGSSWYHVQSINGTSVYFDGQEATAAAAAKGFQPATASGVTFYMLQPTQVTIGSSSTVYAQTFSGNGTSGNAITISGGWDSTAMTTQSGWTTIDMMNWTASAINLTGSSGFITVDHFNFTRCAFPLGLVSAAKGYSFTNGSNCGTGSFSSIPLHAMSISARNFINVSGSTAIVYITASVSYVTDGTAWSITNCNFYGCTSSAILVATWAGSPGITITGCNALGNNGYGFSISSTCGGGFYNNTANNNSGAGFDFASVYDFVGYNLTAQGNVSAQVVLNSATVEIYGLNTDTPLGSSVPQISIPVAGRAAISNWTQYTGSSPAATLASLGGATTNIVASQTENNVAGDDSLYLGFGTITTTGVATESGSGLAWKLTPNSNAAANTPLRLGVGKIVCPANVATSIQCWVKASATSGINGQFRIFGGRYPGVGSAGIDTTTTVSGTSWTLYTITVAPTENCVVEVFFETWGSSTQSMTISGPVNVLIGL